MQTSSQFIFWIYHNRRLSVIELEVTEKHKEYRIFNFKLKTTGKVISMGVACWKSPLDCCCSCQGNRRRFNKSDHKTSILMTWLCFCFHFSMLENADSPLLSDIQCTSLILPYCSSDARQEYVGKHG